MNYIRLYKVHIANNKTPAAKLGCIETSSSSFFYSQPLFCFNYKCTYSNTESAHIQIQKSKPLSKCSSMQFTSIDLHNIICVIYISKPIVASWQVETLGRTCHVRSSVLSIF